jgi:hypothetical protein
MMKKLFLVMMLLPFLKLAQAQEEIVKWTFPTGQMGDTIQNGTNTLNLTRTIRASGTSQISMKNGETTSAAQATKWDNGMDSKYWNIRFKTTGYDHVQISSKQQSGESNPGPRDFKLQYKISSAGSWTDVPGGSISVSNLWSGAISNLDLPAECQNQSDTVIVRWIMTSNTDIFGGIVAATGTSKIDDIIVTGSLLTTGLENEQQNHYLRTFPNPSTSAFSIEISGETTRVEIYNALGKLMYTTIPDDKIVMVNNALQPGMYFIKARNKGQVSVTKHIVQ